MKRPLLCACLLFLLSAAMIIYISGPPDECYREGNVTVKGTVEKKELKKDLKVFYLKDVGIAGEDTQTENKECGLICYTDGFMPPVGAKVTVRGSIRLYSPATNPGEFDMRRYYLCLGYGGRLDVDSWELAGIRYSAWKEGLWELRCSLGELYDKMLGEDDSAVMKAMVLGDKGDLSAELKDLYRANGISHILAISGLHISILGMGLYKLLRKSGVRVLPAAAAAVFIMVNYAVLTGAGTSTVRAVMMFSLMAVADVERRSYDLPTALGLSAATAVMGNPYILLTSSFWLSYSAVAGVAVFGPALWGELRADDKRIRKLLQGFGASVAVSIFTMPLILDFYYEIPVYSVLLNLIVIPLMSILMVAGLIMLPVGMIWLPAGVAAGLPVHLILRLYSFLCESVSKLPGHTYIAGAPPLWKMILVYAVFFILIFADKRLIKRLFKLKRDVEDLKLCIVKLCVCFFAVALLLVNFRGEFKLTMLDVGQGDGFCIETKKLNIMIDGGSTSKDKLMQYQLKPFLKYEGIGRVDLWFVTHPDTDHLSGLMDMLKDEDCEIKIGAIVLPDAKGAEEDFHELISLARGKDIDVFYNSAGKKLEFDDLGVLCLHPAAGYDCEDVNEYSQILEIVSPAGFSGIFTGDATVESEAALLNSPVLSMLSKPSGGYDILKLGHHGSHTSSSQEFLDLISPRIVLVSCGADNPYGHPHKEVMERTAGMGCAVYRTDHDGCITIRAAGGRYEVSSFCR
ncbi:MAG: DNA internalization-related competence protein ComEC/Rec2 [Lachnospiraceae bacterium]|nr:DNA internalization-related competence protein ComEC/Rec2 [Lachnospiraceae bacterium]